MAVDRRHLRIARDFQGLVMQDKAMPLICACYGVRLYTIDDEDRVVWRCLSCNSRYYPSESQYREWERIINES